MLALEFVRPNLSFNFCYFFAERVEKVQQKVRACKKNNVLQSKIAQEDKLNVSTL